jgi:Zn ribbon nucleic-acid-binding protein
MSNEANSEMCPRCGAQDLRAWRELNEEEREVVRRLPASAEQTIAERAAQHRWCVRCWYEETSTRPEHA